MAHVDQNATTAIGGSKPEGAAGIAAAPQAETAAEWMHRTAMGVAWALKPERLAGVLPTAYVVFRHLLEAPVAGALPDPGRALRAPDGLVGICDELTPEIALKAYASGLYPWSHIGPQKWWSPEQRSTLFFDNYRIEKNLRRLLRQKKLTVTFDRDFEGVMTACAEPRPDRIHITWISPQIIDVFTRLHGLGHAHSVEVWDEEGALVGGAYGLAIGKVFFTESQFFRKRDASKVGFAVLNQHLQKWGFAANDGKFHTGHLGSLGFFEIGRSEHISIVERFGGDLKPGRWQVDPELDAAQWQPGESEGLGEHDVRGTQEKHGE